MRCKAATTARASMRDRRLRADVFFIRTQSAIRADGPPSAQVLVLQFDVSCYVPNVAERPLRAPRANHVSGTEEKRIRTTNMVMDKNQRGLGLLLCKIAECARTGFRPRNVATLRR
jgi:hypothetical protein